MSTRTDDPNPANLRETTAGKVITPPEQPGLFGELPDPGRVVPFESPPSEVQTLRDKLETSQRVQRNLERRVDELEWQLRTAEQRLQSQATGRVENVSLSDFVDRTTPPDETETGEALRDQALERLKKANREWRARMIERAIVIAKDRGEVCSEDLRAIADELDDHPVGDPRAYGTIFGGSDWRKTRTVKSRRKERHAGPVQCWAYEGGDDAAS